MCLIYKIKIPTPNINDDTTTINPVLLESEQRVQSLTGSATETTNLSSMENDKNFETESLLDNDTTEAVPRNSYIVVEKKCWIFLFCFWKKIDFKKKYLARLAGDLLYYFRIENTPYLYIKLRERVCRERKKI